MNLYTFVKFGEEGKPCLEFAQVVANTLPLARLEIDFTPESFTVIPIPDLVAKTMTKGHEAYLITNNEDLQEF